jgi:Holliday junction resolvasome RuvABC DNA-binding subunit
MQSTDQNIFAIFSDSTEDKFIASFFDSRDEYEQYSRAFQDRLDAGCALYDEVSFLEEYDDEVDIDDAMSALQALGYKKKDAQSSVDLAIKSGVCSVEEVVQFALGKTGVPKEVTHDAGIYSDSVDALVVLGYKRKDVETVVDEAMSTGITATEDIVKYCLSKIKLI